MQAEDMSEGLIFVTEGSGLIGFRTLVLALENGFAVERPCDQK
jgi:hypothetical protein